MSCPGSATVAVVQCPWGAEVPGQMAPDMPERHSEKKTYKIDKVQGRPFWLLLIFVHISLFYDVAQSVMLFIVYLDVIDGHRCLNEINFKMYYKKKYYIGKQNLRIIFFWWVVPLGIVSLFVTVSIRQNGRKSRKLYAVPNKRTKPVPLMRACEYQRLRHRVLYDKMRN